MKYTSKDVGSEGKTEQINRKNNQRKAIGFILMYSFLVIMIAVISPLLGGGPSTFSPGFLLWGTAPLLLALLMRAITRDWSDSGIKPAFKKNAKWYLLSITIAPVTLLYMLLCGAILKGSTVSGFEMGPYLITVLSAFVFFFIFAIFEEFGWRGYLVPKLESAGMKNTLGYIITAVVWTTWHLPYIRELTWVFSSEDLALFILRYYLFCFAASILYNEMRLITGSVWPAVLMHALANSLQHPFVAEFVTIAPGLDYLFSTTGLFVIVFMAALGITLNRIRIRQASSIKARS